MWIYICAPKVNRSERGTQGGQPERLTGPQLSRSRSRTRRLLTNLLVAHSQFINLINVNLFELSVWTIDQLFFHQRMLYELAVVIAFCRVCVWKLQNGLHKGKDRTTLLWLRGLKFVIADRLHQGYRLFIGKARLNK